MPERFLNIALRGIKGFSNCSPSVQIPKRIFILFYFIFVVLQSSYYFKDHYAFVYFVFTNF